MSNSDTTSWAAIGAISAAFLAAAAVVSCSSGSESLTHSTTAEVTAGSMGDEPSPPLSGYLTEYDGFDRLLQFPGSYSINGRAFPHSVWVCDCNGGIVRAELGNAFGQVSGWVGVSDDDEAGTVVDFTIESEDGLLFETTARYGEDPKPFTVDVSNVLRLTLKVVEVNRPGSQSVGGVFADLTLVASS